MTDHPFGEYKHIEPGTVVSFGAPVEAGNYEQATQAGTWYQAAARHMRQALEFYAVELAVESGLADDKAVMGSLDEAVDALLTYEDAITRHLRALAAHQAGAEYADSVEKPADGGWLKGE